jgi:hypothetical protein
MTGNATTMREREPSTGASPLLMLAFVSSVYTHSLKFDRVLRLSLQERKPYTCFALS